MSACGTGVEAKLDPRNVFFGRNETCCVDTVADVAGSLDAVYFDLEDVLGNAYYAWFDVDGGSIDPAPGGTGIQVVISTGDSANAVATALENALDASTVFYSDVRKNQVLIVTKSFGEVSNPCADGAAPTGFSFAQVIAGTYEDLGKTSGPVSFSKGISVNEIKADQTGENLQDELITGFEISIACSFMELTKSRLTDVVGKGEGSVFTGGTSDVFGYGSNKVGSSRLDLGGSLILLSDAGEDPVVIWKCVPDLQSLNYSGVEQQVGECEFKAYVDETKVSSVNIMMFGDHLQDELWN